MRRSISAINFIRQPGLRIGAYAGYHYLDQIRSMPMAARRSQPTASSAAMRSPTRCRVITQNNHWNSLRVGLDAKIALGGPLQPQPRRRLAALREAERRRHHWLRIGTNPGASPAGSRKTARATAISSRRQSPMRYNPQCQLRGRRPLLAHGNAAATPISRAMWSASTPFRSRSTGRSRDIGVFVQGSFKFGPYPTGGIF